MAFLGGIFGSIGQLLPGYMEGQRQAVADNWNDLSQYNQIQEGQLNNLFNMQTFDDRLAMMEDAMYRSGYQRQNDAMTLEHNVTLFPGMIRAAQLQSGAMPHLQQAMDMAAYTQALRSMDMYMNPWAYGSMMSRYQSPFTLFSQMLGLY